MISTSTVMRSGRGSERSMAASSASTWSGLISASNTASTMASLSVKTWNKVPSDTWAATAICRVVTRRPYSRTSGVAAATIDSLCSSAGSGRARGMVWDTPAR